MEMGVRLMPKQHNIFPVVVTAVDLALRDNLCIIMYLLQAGIACNCQNSGDESCKSYYTFHLHFHIVARQLTSATRITRKRKRKSRIYSNMTSIYPKTWLIMSTANPSRRIMPRTHLHAPCL